MKKIIHHLRKQPEDVRRHILHIVVFIIAAVLLILWGFSLGKSFSSPSTKEQVKQDLQPFSLLKNSLLPGNANGAENGN
jgi:UPF0716 family protein affecting phage T7 exclusion